MSASFTLQLGNEAPIDLTSLSAGDLKPVADDLAFVVSAALEQSLDTPLAQINPPHNTATLSHGSGQQSWTPSNGPLTFTLSGSAGASVTVINSGSIFGKDSNGNDVVYYDGFDNPQPIKSFNVPAGIAFIVTQLNLGISGSVTASSNFDAVGVKADVSGSTTYAVTHYKAFPVGTKLRDSLPQAIAQFVLPLHAQTAAGLGDQDVLAYAFDGTLEVGFGLNYGITGSLAGYSTTVGLPVSDLSKVISVSASVKPSYTIGASFAIKFPWSRVFQCIVQRTNNSGVNTATVHIFQQSKSEINAEVDAGVLTASLNASASASFSATDAGQVIQQKLFGTSTPPPGFTSILNAGTGELNQYVSDVNGYVNKLLSAIPSGQSGIALIIDSLNTTTSCFQYVFNVADANFQTAWNTAMSGDYVGSFNYPTAVSLAAGSGFEKSYQKQTSLKLEIFGYTAGTAITTFYSDASITYAGGGRFQISSKTGRSFSSSSLSSNSSTDLYFSATADSTAALQASNFVVSFNAVLTANKNSGAVRGYAELLNSLASADAANAGARLENEYADGSAGPVAIHFTFATSAYKKITSTPFVGGKPVAQQYQNLDEANWDAYAKASDVLRDLDPAANQLSLEQGATYEDYSSWAYYNQTLMKGGTPPPDRRLLNPPGGVTEEVCDTIMTSADSLGMYGNSLGQYELGGQEFMNLCDDLRPIVNDQSAASVGWTTVQKDLGNAAKDLDPWFGAVTVLALANLCATSYQVDATWGTETAAINVSIT